MASDARMLSDGDVEALAEKLIDKVHQQKHDFWIDPEEHYIDHSRLRALKPDEWTSLQDLVRAYSSARSLFWKAFLGFAIVGALALAVIGVMFGVKH